MSIATAKRRRKQARMNNRHLAALGRRMYGKKSAERAANQLRKVVEGEKLRKLRKGMKGKK